MSAVAKVDTTSRVKLVAIAALVLLLTACGVRIDTQLAVDASGAGARVMTLTLSDNEDALIGGVEAVDASIRRHLPEGVEYSGIARDTDDALVLTLSVPFSSADDYQQTMASLLTAGDLAWPEGDTFTAVQSDFIQGVHLEESFSSGDLLAWMFAGLVADGVVAEENEGDMWELGETTVDFNGVSHESSNPISFSQVADKGFSGVDMTTSFGPEGLTRDIAFTLAQKAQYNSDPALYDGYFAALTEAGLAVEVDASSTGMAWTVGLSADDAEGLAALTNQALSSEETAFTVTPGADGGTPMTLLTEITDFAECSAICSPEAPPVTDTIALPEGNLVEDYDAVVTDAGLELTLAGPGAATATLVRPVSFESTDVELEIARDGEITWSAELTLPTADVEVVGEDVETALASDGEGDVSVSEDDGKTTYTVVLTGEDAAGFQAAFQRWSGSQGAYLAVVDAQGSGFFRTHYLLEGALPLADVLGASLPADGVDYTLSLPGGESFVDGPDVYTAPADAATDGSSATFRLSDGESFSFEVTGTPIGAWIVYGVLAALLLALAAVGVLFRRQVRSTVGRAREAWARRAAARASAAPPQTDGAPSDVPPAVPVAYTSAPVGTGEVQEIEADYL